MAKTARTDRSEAVIGESTRVRGRVSGDGNLLVEGQIEGDITIRGDLSIASGGTATSNVDADAVSVSGTLEGDVNARGTVSIESGATVRGNIRGASVSIAEGAEFAGRLDSDFDLPPELSGGVSGGKRR